ncbi:MAG: PQQ-dependent dehydrogenase, methanol/ethanol family [Alphaproteobacteria bacterium]|nr:PQQ-dependent dehydrogenase, methanol/ethanol family [Alphaproteobacteria bacterium]
MRAWATAIAFTAIAALAGCNQGSLGPAAVDGESIVDADSEPGNWLTHGRTYSEQRYSPLEQINAGNVGEMGLAWSYELPSNRGASATPIVVDGVMYVTSAWSNVVALNAATGEEIWKWDAEVPRSRGQYACCDVTNRGVAVWNGKVYVATIDGRLVALNAEDGAVAWSQLTVDQSKPYTITGAPRAANGLIYIGNGGAEYGVRGYVSAYDAATGELKWRFYTTPNPEGPDNAASDSVRDQALATWNLQEGAWRQSGGGGTAWDSIVYDSELNRLWIGVGNGSPWNRQVRSPDYDGNNDNLYLSSIVAVDADTGAYQCHYQTTPGDTWDYTATQHIMLATLEIEGQERKVAMQAPKNGYFYVLDRNDCKLISAAPIAQQTWTTGIDQATGRPIENPEARFVAGSAIVLPSPFGAHNWHPMAMSQQTGFVYIPVQELAQDFTTDSRFVYRPGRWNTGTVHAGLPMDPAARRAVTNSMSGALLAWDPVNQRQAWRVELNGAWNGGALATAGNLVFQGTVDGHLAAYNAQTGEKLWDFDNQAATLAGPMTYMVGDTQYVASLASYGSVFFLAAGFAAPREGDNLNGRVNVFRVGGEATLPPRNFVRAETPEPPALRVPAAAMLRGEAVYGQFCNVCHGPGAVGGGVIPDIRRSTVLQDQTVWLQTIHGAREENGMPDFSDWITPQDAELVRAYVAQQARLLYNQEHAQGGAGGQRGR